MNSSKQTCTIQPWGKEGIEITFSGSAIFRFTPAGPPTTDRRPMRDEQGRIWLMSGHHSFTLEEQGRDRNRIEVMNNGRHGSGRVKGKTESSLWATTQT